MIFFLNWDKKNGNFRTVVLCGNTHLHASILFFFFFKCLYLLSARLLGCPVSQVDVLDETPSIVGYWSEYTIYIHLMSITSQQPDGNKLYGPKTLQWDLRIKTTPRGYCKVVLMETWSYYRCYQALNIGFRFYREVVLEWSSTVYVNTSYLTLSSSRTLKFWI